MTAFGGPHVDGVCVVCGQRLVRVSADDDRHPWCDLPSPAPDEDTTTRALLTLGASGVGAEVLDGVAADRAALRLGATCGRRAGDLTLTYPGEQNRYLWPDAWARAVADLAALEESGVDVSVDFQPYGRLS